MPLCVLGTANSRTKDYFDLWVLLHGHLCAPADGAAHKTALRVD